MIMITGKSIKNTATATATATTRARATARATAATTATTSATNFDEQQHQRWSIIE